MKGIPVTPKDFVGKWKTNRKGSEDEIIECADPQPAALTCNGKLYRIAQGGTALSPDPNDSEGPFGHINRGDEGKVHWCAKCESGDDMEMWSWIKG